MSMLWFWTCYVLVTFVGMLHTSFNIIVLHMKSMDATSMGEGYERTKPWHPLYNLVLFPFFGWLYIRGLDAPTWDAAWKTGALWVGICIVFDLVGWVLIKHPWRLTLRQFYIEYQPWITMIYLIIFLAPVIGYGIWRIG